MITKEEYQKTLIRIWDSVRDDNHKGEGSCAGVICKTCPIEFGCGTVMSYYDVVEFVEKHNLLMVPVFYVGPFISWGHVESFVGQTKMGGDRGEGVVVKNQTTLNTFH
jgi:hypothetical protein